MFTVSTRRKVKRKAKSSEIKSARVVITDNFIALNVETLDLRPRTTAETVIYRSKSY